MHIVLQLPAVARKKDSRPANCPYCKGTTFQSWGKVKRGIKDTKVRSVQVKRYKCTRCQKTFRDYPAGVKPSQQSERLMKACAILWSLGLSHRSPSLMLGVFGVSLSHMSGWRNVQAAGQALCRKLKWKAPRLVGVDGAWVNGKGVMVAVDLGDGELLALAQMDEKDKHQVSAWLQALKQQHQIGAIVTDDLALYKEIARTVQVGHQVCQFHVRRWVGKALQTLQKELDPQWLPLITTVYELVHDLPSHGAKVLYEIWQALPARSTAPQQQRTPLEKLRDLVLRLSQDWQTYLEFYHDPGIPWTNNATERMIGKIKSRAKRVRGYKTSDGLLLGSWIAAQSWC